MKTKSKVEVNNGNVVSNNTTFADLEKYTWFTTDRSDFLRFKMNASTYIRMDGDKPTEFSMGSGYAIDRSEKVTAVDVTINWKYA